MPANSARAPENAAPPASSARAPPNTVSATKPTTPKLENAGRWTAEEHRLFLQGLEQHGKGWKDIATLIQSRTVVQIRTHAQKYFQKLAKARQNGENVAVGMCTAGGAVVTSVSPGHNVHIGSAEGREIIAIPVGGSHHGNMSLGNDPMAAARSQVGIATAAGLTMTAAGEASGGGRKRHIAAPMGGTKRRAIGNIVSPRPAVSDVLDPYVATTTMGTRPPPLIAGTAAAAIDKKNGRGRQQVVQSATHGMFPMAALEDAVFCTMTSATGAPSSVYSNAIVDPLAPSDRIPIAHTQYLPRSAPAPAPRTAYHRRITTGMPPTGVADMSLLPCWVNSKNPPSWYNDGSDIDTLLEDADYLNWDPTGGVDHPSMDSLSFSPTAHEDHVEDVNQLPSFLDENAHTPPPPINDQPPPETATTAATTLPYSSDTEAVEYIVPEHKLVGVGACDTNFMGFPDLDMGDDHLVSALLEPYWKIRDRIP